MGWLSWLSGRRLIQAHRVHFVTVWARTEEEDRTLRMAVACHRRACEQVRNTHELRPHVVLWLSFEALPTVAAVTGFDVDELLASEVAYWEAQPEHLRRYYGLED